MAKQAPMTKEAARRIQSEADKSGKNQDFKARVMRAADRNEAVQPPSNQETSNGQNGTDNSKG